MVKIDLKVGGGSSNHGMAVCGDRGSGDLEGGSTDPPLMSGPPFFCKVAPEVLGNMGMKFRAHWITDIVSAGPTIHAMLIFSL
jgi:hypothetical protein